MIKRSILGRLGGEEFAVLLDGQCITETIEIAERQRLQLAACKIGSGGLTLTCSFGVSEWTRGDTIDQLLKRADMALYEAKIGGRNRVVAADQSLLSPTYSEAGRSGRTARKSA